MIHLTVVERIPPPELLGNPVAYVPVDSDYVRHRWLPLVGPTAYLVLTSAAGCPPSERYMDTEAWAQSFGVRPAALANACKRLHRYRLAINADDHLTLPLHVRTVQSREQRGTRREAVTA